MTTHVSPAITNPLWKGLAPICAIAFMEFLAMGLPLPILPVHVHETLGFVWLPGLGLSLSALGFGAIAEFSTLRFGAEGWSHAALMALASLLIAVVLSSRVEKSSP